MKKILILSLVLLFPFLLKSQVLSGVVYDDSTKQPLPYATVYFGGSAIGTSTNENGRFTMPATLGKIPLVVSSVGYQTNTIKEYNANSPLKIYLVTKVTELTEVFVQDEGISYEEKVQLFKQEFLGQTPNGLNCKILNIDDVTLTYNKKKKKLIASSDAPIEIENQKLGYQIQYFLDKFIKSPTGLTFEGNFVFKDIPELATQKQILRNREKAYKGSRMHFIRALYSNSLERNGFKLTIPGWRTSVDPDSLLIVDTTGRKFLRMSGRLALSYYNNLSYLSQNTKTSIIDPTGFYDVTLKWSGKMSEARVGDLLPFDYNFKKESEDKLTYQNLDTTIKAQASNIFNESPKIINRQDNSSPTLFFERVYLHTDRDIYAQGDTLWYKAYVTNAQNNRLINYSKNLYVELILVDSSRLISKQMIRLEGGTGKGDFTIFDSIPAGKYHLRAYTQWMLNFGEAFLFNKEITVLNTASTVEPETKLSKNTTKNVKPVEHQVPATVLKNTPNIRFFPEGGQLVEGLTSLVAVKAEDSYGLGMLVKGAVIDLKGDTVTRFRTDSLGFGILILKPLRGQQYRAVFDKSKAIPTVNLPEALSKGINMRVSNKNNFIQIIIGLRDPENPMNAEKEFSLVGKHRGQVYYSGKLKLTASESLVKLPTSNFPEGIVELTLYDDNRPVCERLVFIDHEVDSDSIVLSTDKQSYQLTDSVIINIKGAPNAHLSVAVVDEELVPIQAGNIVSYLMLESEVRGHIEKPERYFDETNPNRLKQLDLLLMTQGWREFVWRSLEDTTIAIKYNIENGVKVAGQLTDKRGKKPLTDINVSLYASAAKGTKLFSVETDSAGRFSFHGLNLYGEHLVKLSATDSKGEKTGIITLDTIHNFSIRLAPADTKVLSPKNSTTETEASLIRRLSNSRKGSIKLKEVKITASKPVFSMEGLFVPFGNEQSFKITEKDYEFKNLEWWMLHNVKGALSAEGTGVFFRGVDTVLVPMPFGSNMYTGKTTGMFPRIFVNGRDYFTDDSTQYEVIRNMFFTMPIEKFDKIVLRPTAGTLQNVKVMQAATIVVDRYFLYLTLKPGALEVAQTGSLSPLLSGYYTAREFYVPNSTAVGGDVGLRATLYWKPFVITNEQGKAKVSFKNATQTTAARIIVQGITNNGKPITAIKSFLIEK